MADPPIVRPGARVRLEPWRDVEPAGVWKVLDRAPEPACWWVRPWDEESHRWLAAKGPLPVVQGHVEYPSRLMRAPDVAALF